MTHLVLILVLAAAVQSGACPIMCICKSRPQNLLESPLVSHESVTCGSPSENVTRELDAETHDLTFTGLTGNQLDAIVEGLLDEETKLPYLAQLTITRSVVPGLINLTFSGFPRLRSINLSANKIGNLSDTFLDVASLQILDLFNNTIVEIKNEPFRTLRYLEVLNLSANFLTMIEATGFSGLNNLKCLDLSNNNLTNLDDRLFAPLQTLQYLNLSTNQLKVLNKKCFISLLKLQQLDLSQNQLIHLELDSLQLPSLARLLLAGNPKLVLSVLLVGTGQRLQTVDVSQIGLKQVPAALTHSIRTLRLAENSIKTVRCGDLDSYPLLQLLDFTSNQLELIEDDALGRLDSLTILYLTNNSMKEIPKSLSEKLKILHLEQNAIEKIGGKDLQGMVSLEVLLLNNNKIKVIEEEAFNQLGSLVTLDISRNPIKILGCLSGSMALHVLRLSNIGVISPAREVSFPLSSTEHLITLDLSGSPGLARQLLVDTAALAASRELQELNLSHTELDYIRSDLLHFLPQLRILHIQGNPINCSQLEWLATWMRRQDEPEYKKIVCASPPELWGTLLVDLQEYEISVNYVQMTPQIYNDKTTKIHENNLKALMSQEFNDNIGKHTTEIKINNETETFNNETLYFYENITSTQLNGSTVELYETTATTHLEVENLTNVNEVQESPRNKLDRESGNTEISRNLFIASKEKTFNDPEKHNNKLNELFPEVPSVTSEADVNSNSSHGEMSMFSARDEEQKTAEFFPGVLPLIAVLAGATTLLATLAVRFLQRRRAARKLYIEELEVNSLPGVTELW